MSFDNQQCLHLSGYISHRENIEKRQPCMLCLYSIFNGLYVMTKSLCAASKVKSRVFC